MAAGNQFSVLHEFVTSEGHNLYPLAPGQDGAFYGCTDLGRVFRVAADGSYTELASPPFNVSDSFFAFSNPLLAASDGGFYFISGLSSTGGQGDGVIYRFLPGKGLDFVHQFNFSDGTSPAGPLVQSIDGNLCGVTRQGNGFYGTVYRLTLPAPYVPPPTPEVSVAATVPETVMGEGQPGDFTVTLSAPQPQNVFIRYKVSGSAANGTDYVALTGTKKIKAGKTRKTIKIQPQGNLGGLPKKKVKFTLLPDSSYEVMTTGKTQVVIRAAP